MKRISALLGSLFLVAVVGCNSADLSGYTGGADGGQDAGKKADNPRETPDTCGNGIDDNDNGEIDEGCSCTVGRTQSCWPGDPADRRVGACKDGKQTCVALDEEFTMWGPCEDAVLPTADTSADGIDQDCNGEGGTPTCTPVTESCTNGKDDDCDGKTDCADSNCSGAAACQPVCTPVAESCTNGKDDDCDGKIDCADSNCSAAQACAPACVPVAESCTNGKDDDCDGKVDCADSNCATTQACAPACHKERDHEWVFSCDDGKDDDCDGKTDCDDPDCWDEDACKCTETCTTGAQRWCDDANFCHWGTQTCGPDRRWGTCHEVQSRPQGCGNGNFYDEDCCVDAGECCQAMDLLTPLDYSVGVCEPVSVHCTAQ